MTENAILAGGCFWGMEELFRNLPGVLDTEVGYAGGTFINPTYSDMRSGKTGHAEALRITFDPAKINYETIIKFFLKIHDPTTRNRQGNDVGSQYRSLILYADETQRATAEEVIAAANASGKWPGPIVTTVEKAGQFYEAESYHQDYLVANPNGYTCHYMRENWDI